MQFTKVRTMICQTAHLHQLLFFKFVKMLQTVLAQIPWQNVSKTLTYAHQVENRQRAFNKLSNLIILMHLRHQLCDQGLHDTHPFWHEPQLINSIQAPLERAHFLLVSQPLCFQMLIENFLSHC